MAGIVDEFQLRAAARKLRFIHEIHGVLPGWIETDPLRFDKFSHDSSETR